MTFTCRLMFSIVYRWLERACFYKLRQYQLQRPSVSIVCVCVCVCVSGCHGDWTWFTWRFVCLFSFIHSPWVLLQSGHVVRHAINHFESCSCCCCFYLDHEQKIKPRKKAFSYFVLRGAAASSHGRDNSKIALEIIITRIVYSIPEMEISSDYTRASKFMEV